MSDYKVDYAKHNARNKDEIRSDMMTTAYHAGLTPNQTARMLFAAGMKTTTADVVDKFFLGRKKWLESKAAEKKETTAA